MASIASAGPKFTSSIKQWNCPVLRIYFEFATEWAQGKIVTLKAGTRQEVRFFRVKSNLKMFEK